MSNEVVEVKEEKKTFSVALTDSLMNVKDALPSDFNITRFVQNSVALMNENEQLAEFAKSYGTGQIKAGMLKSAYLGLDFMNKEAYLIPYKNKLQFMVDYRGSIKLAKKYSMRPIKDIYAKLVRQGDEFVEKIDNGHPTIDFKPLPFNDGAIIGAFAVCLFDDGGMVYETMSKKDIETCRSQSRASNSPAWTKFYGEMAKKSVLHRLTKLIEVDFENPTQKKYFDEDSEIETVVSDVEVPDVVDVVDAEVVDENN